MFTASYFWSDHIAQALCPHSTLGVVHLHRKMTDAEGGCPTNVDCGRKLWACLQIKPSSAILNLALFLAITDI